MKYLRYLCTLLLMAASAAMATAQTTETCNLDLPDIKVQAGKNARLTISLENTMDVTAMQFDITLPSGIAVAQGGVSLSERAKSTHTITGRAMSSSLYRVVVISNSNKNIRGNSGELIYLDVSVPSGLSSSDTYQAAISGLVVSDADGKELPATVSVGVISVATMPDLQIANLKTTSNVVGPGTNVPLTWSVSNIGELPTTAGWTEQIYLVSTAGVSKYLGYITYEGTLAAGVKVNRSTTVTLPQTPTIDGAAVFLVKVVPDASAGEPSSALNNNEMMTDGTVFVEKELRLSMSSLVNETHSNRLYATLTRSGDRTKSQTFALSCSPSDSRISLPSTVTIDAGQSSKRFLYYVYNNSSLDNDSIFNVTVSGGGYDALTHTLKVVDDERPRLFVTLSSTKVVEGETFGITVTAERAPKQDVTVRLYASSSSRFSMPATLKLPAGQTTVTTTATAIDNTTPELDHIYTISASAVEHTTQSASIAVSDNDIPAISMSVSPAAFGEGNDSVPVVATIRRATLTDRRVTVRLTSGSTSNVRVANGTVVMEPGQESVDVTLTPVDNGMVDGSRKVTLTTRVYLPNDGVYASSDTPGYATAVVEVLDDDGPTLSMYATRSTWVEGGTGYLHISRNTSTAEALTVTLSSDMDNRFNYSHTVTIPAGRLWVETAISVVRNTISGDDANAWFTAEAKDFTRAVCGASISDTSRPDATISSFTLSADTVEVGDPFTATVVVGNVGYDVLPAATDVTVFRGSVVVAQTTLGVDVPVDGSATVKLDIKAQANVQTTSYYAKVNASGAVSEMTTSNNTSGRAYIYTSPGFYTELSTDKTLYTPSEMVQITGRAIGNHASDAPVKITVTSAGGICSTIETSCDGEGYFSAEWKPWANLPGHFSVSSCHPALTNNTEQAGFDVYGLKLTSKNGVKYELEEESETTHTITFRNPGPALSNVKIEVVECPGNCKATVDVEEIESMEKGASASVVLRIADTQPSASSNYDAIVVRVSASEGVEVESTTYLLCRPHQAYLRLTPTRMNLTLNKYYEREVMVDLTNTGLRETGVISVSAQKWLSGAQPIASLQPGETATATLRLSAPDNVTLDTPYSTSYVNFNCANGNVAQLGLVVTVVSDSVGRLVLTASDDNTYNRNDHPHLAGAHVAVRHAISGKLLYEGVTDDSGQFVVDSIVEGYYNIKVTAEGHENYSTSYFQINPGQDNNLEAMLWVKQPEPTPVDPDDPPTGGFVYDGEGGDKDSTYVTFIVDIDTLTAAPAMVIELPKVRPSLNMITTIKVRNAGNVAVGRTSLELTVPEGFEMEIIDRPLCNVIPANTTVTFSCVLRALSEDADPQAEDFELSATTYAQYSCGPYVKTITTTARAFWGKNASLNAADWNDSGNDGGGGGGSPSIPTTRTFGPDGKSQVSWQLSNTIVMIGQSLHAYLGITNNMEETLSGLWFDIKVQDGAGNTLNADSLFTCNVCGMDGAISGNEALTGLWTVSAKSRGTCDILLTPTDSAAVSGPARYYIGGTLHYTDPTTGEDASVKLLPIVMYVNPQPLLNLTYFLQRDIYGDDLTTPYIVETSLPAEFSLLVNNVGNGPVSNLNVLTHKPLVQSNSSNNPVDFTFVNSQLNGRDFTMCTYGDIRTAFGTVKAGSTAYAQWWMTCTVLGHFTSYNVVTNFLSEEDEETIIGDVSVHELIHSLHVDNGSQPPLRAFMVDDQEDAEDLPDMLYLTDGTTEDVHIAASTRITPVESGVYMLTVTPSHEGWNYGTVTDPTAGLMELKGVERMSDGKAIDLQNFWQTDRTMIDGISPIRENLVRFADRISGSEETYRLTFAPINLLTLDVETFSGLPAHDALLTEPLKSFDVTFNKAIDPTTFTVADLSLTCQGEYVKPLEVGITQKGERTYSLDVSALTEPNGYYVLTIDMRGITDTEGYVGMEARHAEWMQYKGGRVNLTLTATPEVGGELTPTESQFDYGASVTIAAHPASGYEFSHWTQDGELVTQEPEFTVRLTEDVAYTAHFSPRRYYVEIVSQHDGGVIDGAGSGYYQAGDELNMKVKTVSGYHWDGWLVDGEYAGNVKTMKHKVEADASIMACFTQKNDNLSINAQAGWSWITYTMSDRLLQTPTTFASLFGDGDMLKLVGSDGQLTYDSEQGMVGDLSYIETRKMYKMLAAADTTVSTYGRIAMNDEILIELASGWNWMGYVPAVEMELSTALSALSPADEDIVKSRDRMAVYADGQWHGTLTTMRPGEGYMYLASHGDSFRYPNNVMEYVTVAAASDISLPWVVQESLYPDNTTIIATVEDEDGNQVQPLVGAFVNGECRGVGEWVDGRLCMNIHGDASIDGLVTLQALDEAKSMMYSVDETVNFAVTNTGAWGEPFVLHLGTGVYVGIGETREYGLVVSPNPVHERLYITGALAGVKSLCVYAVSGTVVIPPTVYNADSGLDVSHIVPGYYILGINTENGTQYRRFVKD